VYGENTTVTKWPYCKPPNCKIKIAIFVIRQNNLSANNRSFTTIETKSLYKEDNTVFENAAELRCLGKTVTNQK
jgi:hypothetical protein